MDHTANGHTEEPTEDVSHDFQGLGSFVSFSDDLHKLEEAPDVEDSCADAQGISEGFSPTTVAEDGLVGQHFLQRNSGSDLNQTQLATSSTAFSFDAALNVAFNSTNAELPKQIWETGIWKHIFGNDDTALDFDVWGPQVTRPTPFLCGVWTTKHWKRKQQVRRNVYSLMHAISWMLFLSSQTFLGKIRGRQTYNVASNCGLQLQADGVTETHWHRSLERCATRERCSQCLHMCFQVELQ